LIHIVGHASLRTLQFLRSPSILHDIRTLENAIGEHLPRGSSIWERMIPPASRAWFYRLALERGYLDSWLNCLLVAPFVKVFSWCDAMERRWTDFLSGDKSSESELPRNSGPIEDLL
jgi:NAD(P)H-quinone oxidoreductase subunit 5